MGNVTVKESGEMVNIISPNVNNITSFKVHFSPKQEGTGDPSPENVREIVGWNGVEGYKCGKNIGRVLGYSAKNVSNTSDIATYSTTNKYGTLINSTTFNDLDTPLIIEQTQAPNSTTLNSYQNGYIIIGIDNLIFEKKYNISFKVSNIINNLLNINLNNINLLVPSGAVTPVTKIIDDILIFKNVIFRQNTTNPDRKSFEIRICGLSFTLSEFMVTAVDNDDFTYEPYQGTTTSIDWTNEVGTIYGGYVDLITGEIWKSYDVASDLWKNWDTSGELDNYIRKRLVTPYRPVGGNASSTSLCNIAGTYLWSNITESTHFYVGNSGNTVYAILPKTLDENQEVQISYKLSEPVYVTTLSPTQLFTLKGQNNFWSNADYIEIEYELTETFDIQKAKRKIILNQPHVESMSGDIATFNTDMVGKLKKCKINFLPVQEGEGDPSPENIRNITGWNGAEVFACGKNLVNVSAETRAYANANGTNTIKFTESDSIITIFGGANGGYQVPCKPNTQYTYSFESSLNRGGFYIRVWELEEKYNGVKFPSDTLLINQNINSSVGSVTTFTTKASTHYLIIGFYVYSTAAEIAAETGITVSNFQLELGDTRTSYEPYKGINTLIDWTDSAGTIYGGYIDLARGVLVEKWAGAYIASQDYIPRWYRYGNNNGLFYFSGVNNYLDVLQIDKKYTPIITDKLITQNSLSANYTIDYYNRTLRIRNNDFLSQEEGGYQDIEGFKGWLATLNPFMVYPLGTPIEHPINPVTLKSLRSENNIWSNANGQTEIKFWTH